MDPKKALELAVTDTIDVIALNVVKNIIILQTNTYHHSIETLDKIRSAKTWDELNDIKRDTNTPVITNDYRIIYTTVRDELQKQKLLVTILERPPINRY